MKYVIWKIFPPAWWPDFPFLNPGFWSGTDFNFARIPISQYVLVDRAFSVPKNSLPNLRSQRFSCFLLEPLQVYLLGLVIWCFELFYFFCLLVWCMLWSRDPTSFFLFFVWLSIFPHLLKRLSFPPLNCLGVFIKNQLIINVRVYFWIPNNIPLIYMSLCHYYTVLFIVALYWVLK